MVGHRSRLAEPLAERNQHVTAHVARAVRDMKRVPQPELDGLVPKSHGLQIATRDHDPLTVSGNVPGRLRIERSAHDTAVTARGVKECLAVEREDDVSDAMVVALGMQLLV